MWQCPINKSYFIVHSTTSKNDDDDDNDNDDNESLGRKAKTKKKQKQQKNKKRKSEDGKHLSFYEDFIGWHNLLTRFIKCLLVENRVSTQTYKHSFSARYYL